MEPEKLEEPEVREVMGKISIELDPEHDRALVTPPYPVSVTTVVQTKDGEVHEETVRSAKGTAVNPASDQDLEKKFFGLVCAVIPKSRADELYTKVWGLEKLSDIGDLTALLRS